MKREENLNLLNRVISIALLLLPLGLVIFALYKVFTLSPEAIVLDAIALIATGLFTIFEMIVVGIGGKKESHLQKIAFEENGNVNMFPMIMIIIGTIFGLGLSVMGLILYLTKEDVTAKTNILIILAIGFYLFINCVIYFIFVLFFRKREFNIKDLLK